MTQEPTLIQSLPAHQDKLWSISVHPTLPLLATASSDKTTKIFHLQPQSTTAAAPAPLTTLDDTHRRSIRAVTWNPASTASMPSLATGSFDSTISIWANEDPSESEYSLLALIEGHESEIKSLAFNPSGTLLASCSRDKSIWIWETNEEMDEFECISVLQEHTQDVKFVKWHPTREGVLCSASYDDTIRLWREDEISEDWECFAVLEGHKGTVWSCDFEHTTNAEDDSLRLVSSSDDNTLKIWKSDSNDEENWLQQCTLPKIHTRPVYSVSWSPISQRIASVGSDGRLVTYQEIEAGSGDWEIKAVKECAHGVYEINCVQWCQVDGKEWIVTGGDDGVVNLWSV